MTWAFAIPSPLETFLNNSKAPQDDQRKLLSFDLTEDDLAFIDNCSKIFYVFLNLVFQVRSFFGWKNNQT